MTGKYAGLWIGETMGTDKSPAHLWRIVQRGDDLTIYHRWEGEESEKALPFRVTLNTERRSFELYETTAWFINDEYFVVPGWDTNDLRDSRGPHFDVVFSRPGLGELHARAMWERWRAERREDAQPGGGGCADAENHGE
jgi:hypothetical protein